MDRLENLAQGFVGAKIVLAAAELGLLDRLRPPGGTLGVLAESVGGTERGTRILLDALVALEVAEASGERYVLRPEAAAGLEGDAGDDKLALLRHRNRMYRAWARLEDIVRGAGLDESLPSVLERGPANASFIRAMAAVSGDRPPLVLDHLALDDVRVFADVGGGPGHYAVEVLRRNPATEAYLVDLPPTLEVAEEILERSPEGQRVQRIAWSFYDEGPPPEMPRVDLAFVSQVVHAEGPERNQRFLERLASRLEPGGRIVVHDNLVEPSRREPAQAALFAVNMLAMTERGRTYSAEEIEGWGRAVGLTARGRARVDERSALVTLQAPS
jgi:SAM-dependent methyltransferase